MRILSCVLLLTLCACEAEYKSEAPPAPDVVAQSEMEPQPIQPVEDPVAAVEAAALPEPERHVFEAACAAGQANILKADINNDGQPEDICWTVVNEGATSGVQVGLLTGPAAPYIWLPAHGSKQVAICSTENVTVTVQQWTADYRQELGLTDEWPSSSIEVADGLCDPAHLFVFEGEGQFGFARM